MDSSSSSTYRFAWACTYKQSSIPPLRSQYIEMRLGAGSIKLSAFIEFIPPPDPSPEESFQSANNSFAGTGGGGGGGALRHACPIYYIFHV